MTPFLCGSFDLTHRFPMLLRRFQRSLALIYGPLVEAGIMGYRRRGVSRAVLPCVTSLVRACSRSGTFFDVSFSRTSTMDSPEDDRSASVQNALRSIVAIMPMRSNYFRERGNTGSAGLATASTDFKVRIYLMFVA